MACVGWLRSRQEKQEIAFWLSYAYDTKDKSLSNRLYLLYLIIFFSIWWFIVLVLFAEFGAKILNYLTPEDPIYAALILEVLVFALWWLVSSLRAIWRSPVVFTEEDAYLICQMPIKPKNIVLRWLFLPWIKSLLPIALISATIGFSLAEIVFLPVEFSSEMFVNYLGYGFQILLVITPIHFTLFSLVWVIGIWSLNYKRRVVHVVGLIICSLLLSLILISVVISSITENVSLPLGALSGWIQDIFLAGLGRGEWVRTFLWILLFALASQLILAMVSTRFSPSRSAQETKFGAMVRSMARYGLLSQAKEMKQMKRLRSRERTFWNPSWEGERALLWKDILQNFRIIRFAKIYRFFLLLSMMASFTLITDVMARLPILTVWTIQIGKITSERVRNDLSRWTITKQLPFSQSKVFLFDIVFTSILGFIGSVAGMVMGSIFARSLNLMDILILPGMIVIATGISIFDIVRRSKSSLLMRGQVPQISEWGQVGSVVGVCVPVILTAAVPGIIGRLLSVLSSLLLGWFAIKMAVGAFRSIGDN